MFATRREFLVLLSTVGLTARRVFGKSEDISVFVHPRVPVTQLSDIELEAIFTTDRRFWFGTNPIIPFNLAPHSETRTLFDLAVLRMDPDKVASFWRDRRVRGGAPPPRQAPEPATLVRLVARLEGAIGYAPTEYTSGAVRIVGVVRQGKLLPP